MDTFALMTGATFFFFLAVGEWRKVGAYLWLAILFAIIFSLRMAEPMFYMATAAVIGVLAYRTWYANEDVRDESEDIS